MDFTLHDEKTIQEMLKTIGVNSIDDLYADIPENIKALSEKNVKYDGSFLGAGCYYHCIPSLVDFITSRSEFYTAYTPYQAEASQGMLQAIYEYQTAITRLTQMDVANASMYDGSTALAEAATMAFYINGKKKVLLLEGIHPEYIQVIKTYCWGRGIEIELSSVDALSETLNDEYAGVLFQSPNFFGDIEDVNSIVQIVHEKAPNCVIIQCMTDPTCLGVLSPPGENDIDIFVAEGQSFGISPSFGGPNLGIFTAKEKHVRKMPGRIIGKTKEVNGEKWGFVLTLQAREQHIRRDKALSNICSNQALCMFAALIYLVSMGKTGLKEVATQNFQKAAYVKEQLGLIPGISIVNQKPTYNEFVIKVPDENIFREACKQANLLPPLSLCKYYPEMENELLVCVTEANTKLQIDNFLEIARNIGNGGN
jgi:glycine dehydrogenase subunit 1